MSRSGSIRAPRQPRDTGFPEPFASGRTTTLPHPEADLSPNACIGQEDVHADFVLKRSTLSFLHRSKKHKKSISHGVVPAHLAATPSALSLAPSSTTASIPKQHGRPQHAPHNTSQPSVIETPPSPTASKYARDSFATSGRDYDGDETPPTSADEASMRSHKGLFGKLRQTSLTKKTGK